MYEGDCFRFLFAISHLNLRWVLKIQLISLITSFLFPQKGNDKRKLNF